MYIRDPAGNLVEINWPDVTTLDRSVVTGIEKRDVPQTGEALRAIL
jgi:lactoylglutathione lyase